MATQKQALTIGITLEHEDGVVRAQKWLKGFVTVEVQDEDIFLPEQVENSTLTVDLVGREVSVGEKSKWGHPTPIEAVDIFHDSSVRRIMGYSKLLAHCQYRFPFGIYAPGSIPPTMEYADCTNNQEQQKEEKIPSLTSPGCRIEYRLIASFMSYKTERKIDMIGQSLSGKYHPVTVEPSVAPVLTKSFKWRNMLSTKHRHRRFEGPKEEHHHGCLIWAARVKNTHVGKGEKASFSFALRNASSYDVQKLSARLVEKVSWKNSASHGKTFSRVTELEYVLMPNLAFLNHQKATLSKHQSQVVELDSVLAQEMHEELASHENTVHVPIPAKCRDSHKGKLIQVSHYLIIEARTAQAFSNDNKIDDGQAAILTMELPLKIFDTPMVDHQHHHRQHSDFEVAEIAMTKWPKEGEDVSSTMDDMSWDASESAICVQQIQEASRED